MRINLSSLENHMDDRDIHAGTTGRESGGNGLAASSSDYSVLLPLPDNKTSREAARLVSRILAGKTSRSFVLGMVEVAPEVSLSTGALSAREYRRLLEANDVSHHVKVSRSIWSTIKTSIETRDYDLLVMPWSKENQANPDYRILLSKLLKEPPVDVLILKPGRTHRYKKILVCLKSGSDAGLVMDTALSLAGGCSAELTVVHADKHRDYDKGIEHISTSDHDLIITAAPAAGSNGHRADEVIASILENATATVIIAKASLMPEKRAPLLGTLLSKQGGNGMNGRCTVPVSEVVDKWFAENTFHADEFADIEKLVEAKRKQGLTISLGLPTLNEEKTIGVIVETMRTHLCERYPLIDEIVVIDSDSIDSTALIVESLGVRVIQESEILTEWGSQAGKGGALWKSLYALSGDIIAWIDTDIKNIDPRFVYGLVGPLIKYPHIKYVKGFYRRPVKIGDQLIETGGGRVTELTARPLLNLFFPELAGFVQPLSGEYAGRREILERVGFHNGYGVETGLLLNILEKFGLDVMGQVDLVERIHRNQPLESLSKMSFAIMQVITDKLEERHRVELLNEVNKTMKLIKHESDQFYLDVKSIDETMKPPMFTVPEYRERFMGLELGDMDQVV